MKKNLNTNEFASLTTEEKRAYFYEYFDDDDEVMHEVFSILEDQIASTSPDIFITVKYLSGAILMGFFEKKGYKHPVDWHKEKFGIEHFSTNFFSTLLQVAIVSLQMVIEPTKTNFNVLLALSAVPDDRRSEILELTCTKFNTEMPTFEMLWEVLKDEKLTCC
jgi:hypothetical protein